MHATPSVAATPESERVAGESEIDLLTFHRTNYFISGFSERTQVKFQFSIKYDLWPNLTGHTVYFAYTQKSLWDLWSFSRSSPFRENNYNPELFYSHQHRPLDKARPQCALVSERAGLDHESNGEAGAQSRSWNRLFAAVSAACMDRGGRFVGWGVKAWLPFAKPDNDDITDYVGYGELHLQLGMLDTGGFAGSGELAITGRKGTGDHGSVLAEATWRPGYRGLGGAIRFAPYLFVQLFTGQSETLLRYDRTDHSLRVGIALREGALLPPP